MRPKCIALEHDGSACPLPARKFVAPPPDWMESDFQGQPLCDPHAATISEWFYERVIEQDEVQTIQAEHRRIVQEMRDPNYQPPPKPIVKRKTGRPRVPSERKPDLVYFAVRGGKVKIGHTINPDQRLKDLEHAAGAPFDEIVLTTGGWDKEQRYHKRFATHRLYGEWFELAPPIEAEIDRLTTA